MSFVVLVAVRGNLPTLNGDDAILVRFLVLISHQVSSYTAVHTRWSRNDHPLTSTDKTCLSQMPTLHSAGSYC